MSIGMSIIYELKKSMSELYGIQHVGCVQIQRPDQAFKNLAWNISGSEGVMVYSLHIKLRSATHPLSGSICASQHILSVLAEEKIVLLSLPYSLYALQSRFPELCKMEAVDSALMKTGKKKSILKDFGVVLMAFSALVLE